MSSAMTEGDFDHPGIGPSIDREALERAFIEAYRAWAVIPASWYGAREEAWVVYTAIRDRRASFLAVLRMN